MERTVSKPSFRWIKKEMTMRSTKTLLAAASLAVLTAAGAGAANAAPWDHRPLPAVRHEMRYDAHREIVGRERVLATLREHHYRWLGEPTFVRGHYVVKVVGRFGHPAFVEINPYTGALIGDFRI
jgi:hypothetical protein